jgi:hypothetical protein
VKFPITKTTLIYEGEEATPGLLTDLAASSTFNVHRTAQVTKETSPPSISDHVPENNETHQ